MNCNENELKRGKINNNNSNREKKGTSDKSKVTNALLFSLCYGVIISSILPAIKTNEIKNEQQQQTFNYL